jgi:PhzF family phenazine biosynthesis protein
MPDYAFRIVNVFAETPLGGNPLAVFEDARGLDEATMQALALQFNLSETTFIFPSERATARVRIFTPTFEMPFAGHPTLGTAHVVRAIAGKGRFGDAGDDRGVIPVDAHGDTWTLQASAPRARPVAASRAELAACSRLPKPTSHPTPRSCRSGWTRASSSSSSRSLQADAVRRASPERRAAAEALARTGPALDGVCLSLPTRRRRRNTGRPAMVVAFSSRSTAPSSRILARGSACANLGGWLLVNAAPLPQALAIAQGDAVGRPCRMGLEVTADRRIRVSGRVIELGRGTVTL